MAPLPGPAMGIPAVLRRRCVHPAKRNFADSYWPGAGVEPLARGEPGRGRTTAASRGPAPSTPARADSGFGPEGEAATATGSGRLGLGRRGGVDLAAHQGSDHPRDDKDESFLGHRAVENVHHGYLLPCPSLRAAFLTRPEAMNCGLSHVRQRDCRIAARRSRSRFFNHTLQTPIMQCFRGSLLERPAPVAGSR